MSHWKVGGFIFTEKVVAQQNELDFIQNGSEANPDGEQYIKDKIDKKNFELKQIQSEREALEKKLSEVSKVKSSLSNEVKTLEYSIKQLDLSISSNKVELQKLELEISSLNKDVRSIEKNILSKKNAIQKIFFELDQKEQETFFGLFLKNETLSDSVSEMQSLSSLHGDLTMNIEELKNFQGDLIQKVNLSRVKKKNQEVTGKTLISQQYIIADQKEEKQKVLVATKNQQKIYEQRILELEKQQGEISKTIEEMEYTLRQSFDSSLLPLKRSGVLAYPLDNPVITQKYGRTDFAKKTKTYRTGSHPGMDFGASIGTPILASEDGKIIAVSNNDKGKLKWQKFQFGLHILIKHNNNLTTLYAHLSRVVVKEGESVKKGDIIGYSGNTGYTVGPHLHFGVYWSSNIQLKSIPPAAGLVPIGITIDPGDYL